MREKNYCLLEQMITKSKYYLLASNENYIEVQKVDDNVKGLVHKVNKDIWRVIGCKKLNSEICNNFLCENNNDS